MLSLLLLSSALSSEISVTERLFSLGTSFEVSQEGLEVASANKRLLSLASVFDLKDREDQLLAIMAIRLLSPVLFWGAIADIANAQGEKLGRIELNILEVTPWREYHLFDAADQWIATARADIWQLSMEVTAPDDSSCIFATFKKPYYHHVRNEWKILIHNEAVDSRLLLFLPIFHSHLEE